MTTYYSAGPALYYGKFLPEGCGVDIALRCGEGQMASCVSRWSSAPGLRVRHCLS